VLERWTWRSRARAPSPSRDLPAIMPRRLHGRIQLPELGGAAAVASGRRAAVLDPRLSSWQRERRTSLRAVKAKLCSLHADPRTDYPISGSPAREWRQCPNWPLPRGTPLAAYEKSLDEACEWLAAQSPVLLIVSFGADTWKAIPSATRTDDRRLLPPCEPCLAGLDYRP
jgi:hypothetical protein